MRIFTPTFDILIFHGLCSFDQRPLNILCHSISSQVELTLWSHFELFLFNMSISSLVSAAQSLLGSFVFISKKKKKSKSLLFSVAKGARKQEVNCQKEYIHIIISSMVQCKKSKCCDFLHSFLQLLQTTKAADNLHILIKSCSHIFSCTSLRWVVRVNY